MKIKIATLFIFGLSFQALAQTADLDFIPKKTSPFLFKIPDLDSISKEKELSEIVVTAQRSATQRFSTAEAIDVITSKQLNKFQSRSTPEALININGLFIQKTNHGGGSPFVRGLTGNQTLLLVDGIRLSNATFRYDFHCLGVAIVSLMTTLGNGESWYCPGSPCH